MSISILNRGASGGLKPELTVTAPSGSTIDLLQNGIIVATYTLGADETEHTFMVKVGAYTVRGTKGAATKSVEVAIDTVGQYSVGIQYKLWLYNQNDQCEEVTGGWFNNTSSNMWGYPASSGTLTFYDTHMYLYAAANKAAIATTNNKVTVDGYSKIVAVFGNMTDVDPRVMLTTEKTGQINSLATVWFNPTGSNTTTKKDISSATGSYYFSFGLASSRYADLKQLWLE